MNNRRRRVEKLVREGYNYMTCPCCLDESMIMMIVYDGEHKDYCPVCETSEGWEDHMEDIVASLSEDDDMSFRWEELIIQHFVNK